VDLWDLIRVGARRWYVLLPLLVITGAAAVTVQDGVEPEYVAKSTVLVQDTPRATPLPAGQQALENPVSALGMTVEAQALAVKAVSGEVRGTLRAQNLATTYTVEVLNDRVPILTVTARANSAALATATLTSVVNSLDADLQTQQANVGTNASTRVTLNRLDGIGTAARDKAGEKRALFITLAVGVILALLVTVIVDVALRSRRRQRLGKGRPDTAWDGAREPAGLSELSRERAGSRP
jgi:hypothetical protein